MVSLNLLKVRFINIEFGHKLFLIGIFFLASAPLLSSIFLLPSLLIGTFNYKEKFFKDKWNYPFIIASILMILSSIIQSSPSYIIASNYDSNLSIIGLCNWIPLFFCYWGFQPYLKDNKLRKKCLFIIISGSVPIIISGLGQYFFKWYGPLNLFNGFIIWYQRPIDSELQGLTAFFNNQNYAGTWLSIIFFMSLAFNFIEEKVKLKKITSILLTFLFGLTTFLTYSRNAILSIIIIFIIFFKSKKILFLLFTFILSFFLLKDSITNIISISIPLDEISNQIKENIPYGLYEKIQSSSFAEIISSPRKKIWIAFFKIISTKPIFGWGAGSFPILFKPFDVTNINAQHTHNLFFDIALSYGIPSAIIISFSLIYLNLKSFFSDTYTINKVNSSDVIIFNTAWKISTSIFIFSQLFDVTYFDARISIISWILFSGCRNIIKENSKNYINL